MEKPEAKRRTTMITSEEFAEILTHVDDVPFRDLLLFVRPGIRPQETKQLEARHLQIDKQRAVISGEEAKGGGPERLLSHRAEPGNHQSLASERPTGPLFRNNKGNAWTGFAVNMRFKKLQIALGRCAMAERGIPSTVTEDEIERLAQSCPRPE